MIKQTVHYKTGDEEELDIERNNPYLKLSGRANNLDLHRLG
jgi:hypothetical protein